MTFKCNTALANTLAGATDKTDWGNKLKTALGPTRVMRWFKDNDAAATDPFATGTEILSVPLTGEMQLKAGAITGFGVTGAPTIRVISDLGVGSSVLRIEGNGNFVEYSLGLTGSGKDFMLNQNITNTSGIGFTKSARIQPVRFLPSGTGLTAPSVHPKTPVGFRVWDYANEVSPVLTGTGYCNVRDDDIVLDVPFMAHQFGDIKVMRCADGAGVVFGTGGDCFRFAMRTYSMNSEINNDASEPIHAWRINAVPHGRWNSWPWELNFNQVTDTMAPNAFKIEVFAADGTTLDWFEMDSTRVDGVKGTGKPINHANQLMNHNLAPVQPYWTCTMALIGESHSPKENAFFRHICPGVEAEAIHPRNLAIFANANEQWPIITQNQYSLDGLGNHKVSPKWARMYNGGLDTSIVDTYMAYTQITRENFRTQWMGWGFEPGATAQHTWYNGPGGPRADRCFWTDMLVRYATAPDGVRMHGAVPYKEMMKAQMYGYANLGCHLLTNLERGLGPDKKRTLNGEFSLNDQYYNSPQRPLINNRYSQLSAKSGTSYANASQYKDKNGRPFTHEYSKDQHHGLMSGADHAYTLRSVHGIIEAMHSFHFMKMIYPEYGKTFTPDIFLVRQSGWYFGNHVKCWVAGSQHSTLFSSAEIEDSLAQFLEKMYDVMYPIYNSDTINGHALRNLGTCMVATTTDGVTTINPVTDSKAFYYGQMFVMMKQTGLWDIMKNRSAKCKWSLETMLLCLARQAVGSFIDSNGRADNNSAYSPPYSSSSTNFVHPTDWGMLIPPSGLYNYIRKPDGTIGGKVSGYETNSPDTYLTKHLKAQYLLILPRFFPEYTIPRLAEATNIMLAFHAEVSDSANTRYWTYRYSYFGFINAPDYVGPPVLN